MIHRMNLAALFFMAVLLLTGCTNKEKTDFSKYITGYTSGVIKSSSSLSVYLGQPSDKGFQAGSTLPADLYRISPAIKGELILKDNSYEFKGSKLDISLEILEILEKLEKEFKIYG